MEKRKFKKGFTLVELIVVIAIIAILAAVSVVSYLAFVRQANESADIQLVKQLNTSLQGDEVLNNKRSTMHEMLGAMEDNGFVVENLTKTKSGYDIVWDQTNNRFALLDNDKIVYGEESYKNAKPYNVWKFADTVAEAEKKHYSIYLTNDFANATSLTVYAGLDVGDYAGLSQVNYTNTGDPQTVTIRTNGGELEVNAEKDTVNHYDFAKSVDIKAVADKSYHEYGQVGFTQIAQGHYVAENGASVNVLLATGSGSEVKIDNNGAEIQKAYTTDESAKNTQHGGNESLAYFNIENEAGNNDEEKLASAIEKLEASGTMFAGGRGTEEDPFLIYDYESFQHISDLYEQGYNYFKVKDGVKTINLYNNIAVDLNGSFDGNNVVFTHVNDRMFDRAGTCNPNDTKKVELKNFTVQNEGGCGIVRNCCATELEFNNINVTGYSITDWNAGEFVRYGTNNRSDNGFDYTLNFKNCSCNAEIYSTSNSFSAILVGHTYPGVGTATINVDAYTDANINDSILYYTGTATPFGYKYYGAGSAKVYVDGVEKTSNDNKILTNIVKVDSTKIPSKSESGYSITTEADTTKVVVTLLWQYTEWEDNYSKEIKSLKGVGGAIGKSLTLEVKGSEKVKVFDSITNIEIKTGQDKWDYELKDGKLVLFMKTSNTFIDGNLTLNVEQFIASSNIVQYKGSLRIASKTTSSDWDIK